MRKRVFARPRSLLLVLALAVVAALCTVSTARAASPAGSAGNGTTASAKMAASDAPCNFQGDQTCQSTDPAVTVSTYQTGDTSSCTFVWNIDWGDGQSTTDLVVTGPPSGWAVLASHTYAATGTYTISLTGEVADGVCTLTPFSRTFTLLASPPPAPPPAPSPKIHWSRTSGRPGTLVTLTGSGWAPGGTVQLHLPSTGFFIGDSSWKVASNGTWKQSFTVAGTKSGAYTLSFTEASGNLRVTGSFRVLSEPNAGQDWARCQSGSCTVAVDHVRTQVLVDLLNSTPKLQLLAALYSLCNAYTSGAIRAACTVFAAGVVLDATPLARQLSDSDLGHGVYITFLTIHFTKLGITPQK